MAPTIPVDRHEKGNGSLTENWPTGLRVSGRGRKRSAQRRGLVSDFYFHRYIGRFESSLTIHARGNL
jgi:hypothetical protein